MNNIANDVNGVFYVTGSQGEQEKDTAKNHVIVPPHVAPTFALNRRVDTSAVAAQVSCSVVLCANYWYLRAQEVPHAEARRLAFVRLLALLMGLGDIANNPRANNVIYNDVKTIHLGAAGDAGDEAIRVFPSFGPDNAAINVNPYTDPIPEWDAAEEVAWRAQFKLEFTNVVCLIAFMFRTRGHHFLEDFADRYDAIWGKCLYEAGHAGVSWALITTVGLHFIYPAVLDNFWLVASAAEKCAGALIKRKDSYSAGTAAIGAIYAGFSDLIIIFPRFRESVTDAVAELDRCRVVLQGDRWAGSVNRRYYAAPLLVANETILASLASTILSALQACNSDAPLKNSKALQRVANNAPITGSFMAAIMTKAAAHEDMIYAILPATEDD